MGVSENRAPEYLGQWYRSESRASRLLTMETLKDMPAVSQNPRIRTHEAFEGSLALLGKNLSGGMGVSDSHTSGQGFTTSRGKTE